jgi:hypothetical protein
MYKLYLKNLYIPTGENIYVLRHEIYPYLLNITSEDISRKCTDVHSEQMHQSRRKILIPEMGNSAHTYTHTRTHNSRKLKFSENAAGTALRFAHHEIYANCNLFT